MIVRMIKNIIFDFGGVLVDWNPRYFYDSVFEDKSELEYFLTEICTPEWNSAHDRRVAYADNISALEALHPEYSKVLPKEEREDMVRWFMTICRRYNGLS